jgi:hypothetical protein
VQPITAVPVEQIRITTKITKNSNVGYKKKKEIRGQQSTARRSKIRNPKSTIKGLPETY